MIAGSCPDPDRWLAFLDGSVDPAELDSLESHLEACEACLNFVASRTDGRELREALSQSESGPEVVSIMARIARDAEEKVIPTRPDPRPRRGRTAPTIPGLTDFVEIGQGGLGTVYSALQGDLGRRVAVKVLNDVFDESSRLRVLREARVLARLRHPNVVTIFKSGEVDGSPYLVMELVEGGTLQQRLNQGVLPPRVAAATVRQLALAAGEAHSLGIIHRDLKPSNILIAAAPDPGGEEVAKLADFSVARDGSQAERLTLTGQVIGTPSYMAPEQTGLDPAAGEVGPATDIHALGGILHTCLTGRPPYQGRTSWETLTRVARGQFEPIRPTHPR